MEGADQFSLGVKLSDLNDFITPSQSCVKPVNKPDTTTTKNVEAQKRAKIELGEGGQEELVELAADGSAKALKAATVSLADCLACSGCITTAETVLVTAQSTAEFLKRVRERPPGTVVVVTVSEESLASLAAHFSVPLEVCFRKLISLFVSLGASCVLDAAFGRDMSLAAAKAEAEERILAGKSETLPFITAECPGWVCYAEKTQHEVLSRLSRAKSAMAMMGALVKHSLGPSLGKKPEEIYHVAVMPCFDKKLEASREDFADSDGRREVDTVLATTEVLEVLEKAGIQWGNLAETPVARELCPFANFDEQDGRLFGTVGGPGPDGFWTKVLVELAEKAFAVERPSVTWTPGRNVDILDATVQGCQMRFTFAYGFRNIQNVVRKVKTQQGQKPSVHFVELMACPQSCLNGGGQIRPPKGTTAEQWLSKVRTLLLSRHHRQPSDNLQAMSCLKSLETMTAYHAREKPTNALNIKW